MNSSTIVIAGAIALVAVMAILSGVLAYTAARRVPPDTYRHYEHILAEMQERMERGERRSDRQQEQIDRLREMLAAEQDYSRALARAMRDAGLEPPPRPGEPPPRTNDTAALSRRVAELFSMGEIDGMAMELDIDGALSGDTLETRASSLVMAALRRGILSELVVIARRERPRGGF